MSVPFQPVRLEPLLLPVLREALPDVSCGSLVPRLDPPYESLTLVAEPQNMATPVSQYVRLRLIGRCARQDGTGDFIEAEKTMSQAVRILTGFNEAPVIGVELESGPVRMADPDGFAYAYAVLLAQSSGASQQ